jgi:hypothetical protein
MLKTTISTILCCSVAIMTYAQAQPTEPPQTDAVKARYFNAVEYTNCRLAEFSINASNEPKLKASFMAQCKCNPNGGTDANLKAFFKKNGLSKNARIFGMADSLKTAYTAGLPNNELAANITGFLGSAKLTAFGSTKEGFPDFTKNLCTEIDGIFAQSGSIPAPIATTPNGLEPAPIQDATQVSQTGWSKFMTFMIAFLLGVLAGGGAMRYYTLQRAKERAAARRANGGTDATNNEDAENEVADDYSPNSVHLETQITDLQRELERQQTLNAQLRMNLERITNPPQPRPTPPVAPTVVVAQVATIQTTPETETIVETPAPIVELEIAPVIVVPVAPAPAVFFMRIPTYDGLFNDLRRSASFRPAESVYEFTETGKNKASFTLVADAATQLMAIQGFSMYIAPACETNDMFPEYDAERVKTIEPGEAVKEGDVWRVIKKAVIELS